MHCSPLTYTWQIIMADRHRTKNGIKKDFSTKYFLCFIFTAYSWERIERQFWHGNSFLLLISWTKSAQSWLFYWGEISVTMSRDAVDNRVRTRVPKINASQFSIWYFHSVSLLHFIVGVYLACICMREIPSHYIIPLSACIFYPNEQKKIVKLISSQNKWM